MKADRMQPLDKTDVGFDPDSLYSARLLNSETSYRGFVRWVLGILAVTVGSMFLPWQQNVRGDGEVTALRPQDRPQVVPALIAGRIEAWNVQRGTVRHRGHAAGADQRGEGEVPRPGAGGAAGTAGGREVGLARRQVGQGARARHARSPRWSRTQVLGVGKARNKVQLYEAALAAAVVDSAVEQARFERRARLFNEGLNTRTELEANQLRVQQAKAKLVEKRQELRECAGGGGVGGGGVRGEDRQGARGS